MAESFYESVYTWWRYTGPKPLTWDLIDCSEDHDKQQHSSQHEQWDDSASNSSNVDDMYSMDALAAT